MKLAEITAMLGLIPANPFAVVKAPRAKRVRQVGPAPLPHGAQLERDVMGAEWREHAVFAVAHLTRPPERPDPTHIRCTNQHPRCRITSGSASLSWLKIRRVCCAVDD
jgi:hypothetical protein